jgi:hypothetical protein
MVISCEKLAAAGIKFASANEGAEAVIALFAQQQRRPIGAARVPV